MTTLVAARSPAPTAAPRRPANDRAQRLTGRRYVSFSQLSTMRQCPRKFAFLYIENATLDFQASSLLFGAAMHSAFEAHYRSILEGTAIQPGDLLHHFLDRWSIDREIVGPHVPVRFCKGEDMGTITALAGRMIQAFLSSSIARPHGRIIAIEEEFKAVIDPDLPDVLARVDLVTQTDDAIHVVDLKTSRSRWNQVRVDEGAEQLLLYGRTVYELAEDIGLPVKLHFAVVTKAKRPCVQVLDVPAHDDGPLAVRDRVADVWTAARAGNYFPNPSPQNCVVCPFKSRCPAYAAR